jgi:hypothetical protein|nr:MAG TPA: hypothetical protein [Crassvirales sp.]
MIIRDIVFSTNPPATPYVLWIKAGANNINTLHIYDGGWRKIGTSSGGGTSDYNDLENKPKINNVVLEGNLTLNDLGIIIPDLKNYITEDALNTALLEYAKKSDIPSVEGLLSETKAQELYQPRGNYALKSDIPDTSGFITETQVDTKLENYAQTSDIPDTSGLASKDELNEAISNQKFKTINGQEITGEGNIEIQGGGSVTVDDVLSETSVNPVQNKVITEQINTMNELLAQLDEKVFPTTLSVSGGGTYDEGTSQTVMVSWKLMKNGQTLTPDSVAVNGETVDPATGYKVFTDVTTTTTYRVVVVYKGKTYNGSTTATFKKTYYRYYGALPVGTSVGSITEPMITSLKKEVCTSASATLTYNLEDQRAVYAYPSTFGLLTKVLDDATSMPYDDFVKEAEMVIDGENYYIYALQNPSSVTDYKFRFVK